MFLLNAVVCVCFFFRCVQGMAFTLEERQKLGIHGMLPPRFKTQEDQAELSMANIRRCKEDLDKYVYLASLAVSLFSCLSGFLGASTFIIISRQFFHPGQPRPQNTDTNVPQKRYELGEGNFLNGYRAV